MMVSDREKNVIIQKMLRNGGNAAELWNEKGPTSEGCRALDEGGTLSSTEELMLRVAFDIWNGRGKTNLYEMLGRFDDRQLKSVLEAVGSARQLGRGVER